MSDLYVLNDCEDVDEILTRHLNIIVRQCSFIVSREEFGTPRYEVLISNLEKSFRTFLLVFNNFRELKNNGLIRDNYDVSN